MILAYRRGINFLVNVLLMVQLDSLFLTFRWKGRKCCLHSVGPYNKGNPKNWNVDAVLLSNMLCLSSRLLLPYFIKIRKHKELTLYVHRQNRVFNLQGKIFNSFVFLRHMGLLIIGVRTPSDFGEGDGRWLSWPKKYAMPEYLRVEIGMQTDSSYMKRKTVYSYHNLWNYYNSKKT